MVIKERYAYNRDVFKDGYNMFQSLIIDYETYINSSQSFITVHNFITYWNIIKKENFSKLEINDIVYNCLGDAYEIYKLPEIVRDIFGCKLYRVATINCSTGRLQNFSEGELYFNPNYVSNKINSVTNKRKEDKKICPILITKTNQHQN